MSCMRLGRREGGSVGRAGEAPDYAEPILGWRLWCVVREEGLLLRSLFHPSVWPPRQALVAKCERWRPLAHMLGWEHEVPTRSCTCGIYAAHLEVVRDYLEDPPGLGVEVLPRVVGLVSLWGSVVECERGWRASHAYPAAVFLPALSRGVDGGLSPDELGAYGVPVEVMPAERPAELIERLEGEPLPVSLLSSLGGV
jgi:hypothetical protein